MSDGVHTPPTGPDAFDPNDPSLFVARPKWPKVIGIITIVLASLGLLCSVGGAGAAAFFGPMQQQVVADMAPDADPLPSPMTPLLWGAIAFGTVLAFVQFIGGVMCVAYKPAARLVLLLYGVLGIVSTMLGTVAQLQQQAAMQAWAEANPGNPIADQMTSDAQAMGQLVGLAFGLLLGLGIPLFYVIWFGLVKTKPEQMLGTAPAST